MAIGDENPEKNNYSLYPEIQTGKLVCYTGAVYKESAYEADENIGECGWVLSMKNRQGVGICVPPQHTR